MGSGSMARAHMVTRTAHCANRALLHVQITQDDDVVYVTVMAFPAVPIALFILSLLMHRMPAVQ